MMRNFARECFCFGDEALNPSGEAARRLVRSRVEFPLAARRSRITSRAVREKNGGPTAKYYSLTKPASYAEQNPSPTKFNIMEPANQQPLYCTVCLRAFSHVSNLNSAMVTKHAFSTFYTLIEHGFSTNQSAQNSYFKTCNSGRDPKGGRTGFESCIKLNIAYCWVIHICTIPRNDTSVLRILKNQSNPKSRSPCQ